MRLILFAALFSFASCGYIPDDRPDEGADWSDVGLGPVGLITKYKYPAEQYFITTEDGYLLNLIRIPHGRACPRKNNKGVVVLIHALFLSSVSFILPGTKRGLAYILADMCYDVWLPSTRGSTQSRGHVSYSIKDSRFWDFSWHEIGVYDIPAVTDFVRNRTGVRKITYVGHSQGTTALLVFATQRPEYSDVANGMFFLAPVAFLSHSKAFGFRSAALFSRPLKFLLESLKIYSIGQKDSFLSKVAGPLCSILSPISIAICSTFILHLIGFNFNQTNRTMILIQLQQGVQGGSLKQFAHYSQLMYSGKFQQYDYGIKNFQIYGQDTPPEYDLKKAAVPVYAYYSKNDKASDVKDVDKLLDMLPNVQNQYLVPNDNFNHIDYLWSNDIINLVYDRLAEQIDLIYDR